MEVTVSGVPRARRAELQTLIARLRGTYSGALIVGRTAAVVVEGTQLDWQQPKLVAAQEHDIPITSVDWLLDSQHHGFLLAPARYRLQPPAEGGGRRSSAASTSMFCAAAAAAPGADVARGAGPAASAPHRAPLLRDHTPSPERLRDAAPADLLQGGGFLEVRRSPAALPRSGSASGTHPCQPGTAQPAVQADALPDLPPSPGAAAPPAQALGSPALHSPLQLPDAGEQAAAEPAVGAATLAGSPHGGSQAPPTADSDSSAKVARFLSRLPAVTLKRGTCMPRRRPFDSPSPLSSQSLAGSGSASRPAGGAASERRSSGGASWLLGRPALRALQVEAEGAQLERQQPAACGVGE